MKWMIGLGAIAAIIGALYRWLVAPSESDKWKAHDVLVVIAGIAGAAFLAVGLFLLGLREVFRLLR